MGFLLAHFGAFAQTATITGTVTAATDNTSLPGVNVLIKGQTKGTVTDSDGKYSIEANPGDILVFSFIGMETQEQSIGASTTINVTLSESLANLSEVVVVAYGTQKKANVTGAISTVDVDKALGSRPVTDVGRALQGTTPGLIITSASGAIGGSPSIKIRGSVGTINGSGAPMILVDNVEVPDLSYVNPDDIESISVLKDASTTAIYGTRAAFGAVLITTKRGRKDGQVKVNYSNNFSWSRPTKVPQHSRADWNLQYSWDQIKALRTTPLAESGQVGYYYNPEVISKVTNWIDTYGDGKGLGPEMVEGRDFDYRPGGGAYYYRPWDIYELYYKDWAPQQNQNISISGGNDKTQYNFSGGYMNQSGVLNQFSDYFRRLNFTGFVSTEVNRWLTARVGFMLGKADKQTPFNYGSSAYDAMYYLYRWHSVYPYGTYNGHDFRNGVTEMKQARPQEFDSYYSRYNAGATFHIMDGLTADVDYYYNRTDTSIHIVGGYAKAINQWTVTGQKFDELYGVYTTSTYDYAQYAQNRTGRNTVNAYLTWDKQFGSHGVKVMGGTNIEDSEVVLLSAKRNGVFDFDKGEVNLAGGTQTATSSHSWWSVAGFFGRANYSYKDKYILEVNGRYDGSSKFLRAHRWGFYPSGSAAWRISQEPWMQPLEDIVSELKLRASYGEVGSQDVPLNAYNPTLSVTTPSSSGTYWLANNDWVSYIGSAPALTDPNLTWETVKTTDIGLDASLIKGKLGLVADWYQRKTVDMLVSGEVVPSSLGTGSALRNFGELTTKGIEIALNYNHTFSNGIRMTLSGQFTDYKTVITKYANSADPLISSKYYQGKTTGEIWGYKTDGLFQQGDFVYNDDGTIKQRTIENGTLHNTYADGIATQDILESGNFKFSPGDVRFRDLNGDGVINYGSNTVNDPGDKTIIGNTTPRYQYGFRAGAEWKGFDVSIFFQGVGKRNLWATGNMVLPGYYGAEANFAHTLDYWTPDNTGAYYPRAMEYSQTAKWNYEVNDRYLVNAAYLRMKNLTVGYTVPSVLMSRLHIDRLRVYFSGENMFEFDKMHGVPIDPEIDWTTNTSADSRSFGRSYPYRRTYSFGLQLQF
jgi:TonB-linked SusC/RagA family outer membrane protein